MRTIIFTIFSISTLVAARATYGATGVDLDAALLENELVLAAFTSHAVESLRLSTKSITHAAENSSTPFLVIDCEQAASLCEEHDVNAFPTIRLLRRNEEHKHESIRYRGRRTEPAIRSLVTKYEVPVLSRVESQTVEHFTRMDDVVVMAYLDPGHGALLEVFEEVAEKHYGSYVFGYSISSSVVDVEADSRPSIVVYKNNDGDKEILTGHFSVANVEAFLKSAQRSVIREFKEREIEDFMVRNKLTAYIFTPLGEEETTMRRELTPLAKKFEKFVTFAVADVGEYVPMATSFGLDADSTFPALVVHAPMNDNIFLYRQGNSIMSNVVEDMLMSILQGRARRGQVFGDSAPMVEGDVKDGGIHTEL